MPIRTGGKLPYPEFRKSYQREERTEPVLWRWKALSGELRQAEHTEYGTLTLSTPDGSCEIIPGASLTFQAVKPGDRTTPHAHSWWHLYFVRSGTGAVLFDEPKGEVRLNAGDLLLIPAWATHRFENQGPREDLILLNMSNVPQQAVLNNLLSEERTLEDAH